jgi:hypothetical protein
MNLLYRTLRLQRHLSERGFAMVAALVVMTVMFIAVGALSDTRQMWGFASTKQLDRSSAESPARADSATWFRSLRRSFLNAPYGLSANLYHSDASVSRLTNWVYVEDPPTTNNGEPFPAFLPNYPNWGTNPAFSLFTPRIYTPGTNDIVTYSKGPYDPYWGFNGYGRAFAVVFQREMPEAVRELRDGRFSPDTTQLRAWMSMDAGLNTAVTVRHMPMSAFTFFSVPATASPAIGPVSIGTNWIIPSTNSYNFGGYSVPQMGVGRIYVDGNVDFGSNAMVLGFPIATTGLFTNTTNVTFHFPTQLGGGSLTTNVTWDAFMSDRLSPWGNMLATSMDAPQRLMTRFAEGASPWRGLSVVSIASQYRVAGAQAQLFVSPGETNTTVSASYVPAFYSNNVGFGIFTNVTATNSPWVVDYTNRTVTFRPQAGFLDVFTDPMNAIHFRLGGSNASLYTFIFDVPSVAALSTAPERQRLTLITGNPVVLEGGFNQALTGWGAMLVAPRIQVRPPAGGASPVIGGFVVTQASDPRFPFVYTDPATPPVDIVGGLAAYRVALAPEAQPLGVRLFPDPAYLSGQSVPPQVPAVTDIRLTGEDMRIYTMFATETNSP